MNLISASLLIYTSDTKLHSVQSIKALGRETHRLLPHLGVEGCSGSSSRRVGEGRVGEAWGQLCGVQGVRSPGIW